MNSFANIVIGFALLAGVSWARAVDAVVECTCVANKTLPLNAEPVKYRITIPVPDIGKTTDGEVLAYACWKRRDSDAHGACMEGGDRDSSLKYYSGKWVD